MKNPDKCFFGLGSTGFHRIVYSDWGPEDGDPVVCVHGLTGNGHDFEYLARELAEQGYRVICIDMPGRGRSDFLGNPGDYNFTQYVHDIAALLASAGIEKPRSADWIGTSMGGLLGIRLAGLPNSPVRRMILNDVGPAVPQDALNFIRSYIGQTYAFKSIEEFEKRLRETRGLTYGPLTDEQWRFMAEHNARPLPDGQITYSYDPAIADVFTDEPLGDADLWDFWALTDIPVLAIRGAQSMVFPANVLAEMAARKPGAALEYHVYEDCGHVPSLMAPAHIELIKGWLKTAC